MFHDLRSLAGVGFKMVKRVPFCRPLLYMLWIVGFVPRNLVLRLIEPRFAPEVEEGTLAMGILEAL